MNESSPDEGEGPDGESGQGREAGLEDTLVAQPAEGAASLPAMPDAGIERNLAAISGRLDALHQDFESKLKYDAAKDRQLDALHAELQAHRDDLYFRIVRPVLMDLIAMYDDMHGIARHEQRQDPASLTEGELRMQRNLASFTSTIEEILERYGVSMFVDEGDTVSPQRQRSIKQVDTSDAEQDRRIAERLRKGFRHGEKILRPEIVTTYRVNRKTAVGLPDGGNK